ncbi:MAG: MBL fold metallo-hydrolase [Deltaproteobacteria bacterium]|nr:MBL fold metallo-hydrolase [Deltaproteobacteria bacterium]
MTWTGLEMVAATRTRRGTALAAAILVLVACESSEPPEQTAPLVLDADRVEKLERLNEEFQRNVYTVTDGVYQAVGFGIANSIMVEGDDCVFIVDVMGSMETARAVRAEFDEITQKPIRALIYTHNHADHVMGGLAFAPDGEIDVYAHETTNDYINRTVSVLRPILGMRGARMFGSRLTRPGPDQLENVGLGPFVETLDPDMTLGLIRPNKTFSDALRTEICGVRVELVHAPGETNDQLFVWLPERGVLMPGDNIYKAFPNLYSIRGTLYRDVLAWVRSIDKMRAIKPAYLVPSHTRAISGQEQVYQTLTAYRDAIQFVHDQTIQGINRGLTPDQLVDAVKLPPGLAKHPHLQERYGKVAWSVRGIFSGYLGWFDGDAATLEPASPNERARGMASLAGGPDRLLAAARDALADERYAWAAELASHSIRLDPGSSAAKQTKADALRALGNRQINANARNYYITQALELEGEVGTRDSIKPENALSFVSTVPIGRFVAAMPANLDYEKSADTEMLVGFRFPDVDEGYGIHIRRGVAEFMEGLPEGRDLTITVDSDIWREIVLGLRSPIKAFASGEVKFEGSAIDLVGFLRLFKKAAGRR